MYLVSSYWNALCISDMRLLTTPEQVKERLLELWRKGSGRGGEDLEDFFVNGTSFCRVYEILPNSSKGPKHISKNKLKDLLL